MLRKILMCMWIVISASSAKADDAPKLEFTVEFDENGNVQLMAPKEAENDASLSLQDNALSADKIIENKGVFGFEDITSIEQKLREFDGYNVSDASGNTALIMVPAGQAPALWTSEKIPLVCRRFPTG